MLGPWDRAVFHWINHDLQSGLLDPVFWFFSLGVKETWLRLSLAALAMLLLFDSRRRPAVVQALLAFPLANLLSDAFKRGLPFPRPPAELADAHVMGPLLTSAGTMSAHAANMAAVATVFWLRCGKGWGGAWTLVAFLTGVSRIYVGAHYPSQVILGWAGGALCGFVICKVWDLIRTRRSLQRTG
ncbi:phosphatase PAP2 family protein [Fimbriimonadia bacterium ATM]|nr:MAG: phosphatase PAP2 family protein [Armatimonadota bacterium]MBC6969351.1 phosphatase PAP2 family protein [Armatimonadota bacterium]MCE7899311.1 phosphatase PAP2 family protein [Armatimonadetes bacterium ATM1]MDL1927884.1 phosphatase PAP2 family protein [Fimbriimonadia bacterium ATM]RIJ97368.1 MAG: hypothetical protein DCC45_04870 [Armatimonadota bacterium]